MATLLLNPQVSSKPEPPRQAVVPPSGGKDLFRLERGLALMLIIVAAIYLRARDPLYNTAFMDESIYVVYGRMFLARHFEAPLLAPLQWSFGWYLWPAMAALADRIGGLLALREMAALLGTLTVAATYGFASRVFSKTVGLGSAAVMALLAPAVLVSRIATRDSGCVCFFALGLWAFAAAWQTGKKRHWALATVFLFAAFLCKYLIAVYFPVLALLALWKGKKSFIFFVAPLSAASAWYAFLNWADLTHLLRYGTGYTSLRADAFSIYVLGRLDLALVAWLALLALAARQWRGRVAWMWVGALIALAFQWQTRADFDFWKHANYALLFLVPAAVCGVIFLTQQMFRTNHMKQLQWGTAGVLCTAICAGLLGNVHRIEQFVFWPNVNPALAFFEANGMPGDTLLVDDTVFRYYFNPSLRQAQIVDPMYFAYTDPAGNKLSGEEAYKTAVSNRAFSYIVLDGGMGGEARRMDAAIQPFLTNYHLAMRASDPVRGHDLEIYSREQEKDAGSTDPARPYIRLLSPATGSTVVGEGITADGVVTGFQPGWFVRLEVFTDRWYPQGEAIPIATDGSFRQAIRLAGNGRQQCFQLIRARVFDSAGYTRAVALNHDIARSGGDTACPPHPAEEETISELNSTLPRSF